jgi:hypothetical protein
MVVSAAFYPTLFVTLFLFLCLVFWFAIDLPRTTGASGFSLTKIVKEILFPSGAFLGPNPEENARNTSKARFIMFFFYLAFLGFFAYQICCFFFLGRVEVITSTYKMNSLEAPSVAICPFWPNTAIVPPPDTEQEDILHVMKYGVRGPERLAVVPHICKFDRVCICGDLFDLGQDGGPVLFHDHRISETQNIGATGEASESEVRFRERIEVSTNATDGSGNETLKVGFYDSTDEAPKFWYMHQGAYVLGKLELSTWSVQTITFQSIYNAITSPISSAQGLVKETHLFRYTSQEVAHVLHGETKPLESTFSYQMKNFFVDHKIAAETSFSLYAVWYLLLLVAFRGLVVQTFKTVMFPEYDPHTDETGVKRREMSDHANNMAEYGCCFSCCYRFSHSEPRETTRLLP